MTLAIHNLAFERQQETLFAEISFHLQPGELLQVCGRNGCGKSTLLRLLAGYIEPEVGTITWQGTSITQERADYQQQLHYVGHHNGIKSHLTVQENLELNAALAKHKLSLKHLHQMTESMGLQDLLQTQTQVLSAGQRRRLALTRLLLNTAPLWILDEPLTALDTEGQAVITTLLNEHLANGGLAVVATHHLFSLTNPAKMLMLGEHHA